MTKKEYDIFNCFVCKNTRFEQCKKCEYFGGNEMKFIDYKCLNRKCSCTFQKTIKTGETIPARTDCVICGSKARKVYSPVGLAFKGSGFYVNDYKKGE